MKKSQLEMIKNKKYVKNAQKMKIKIVSNHVKPLVPVTWRQENQQWM